ncbi:MAG: sodium:calcium antiporter [Candidatus Altiarchaeota archaeon]|nr:sodium:calcium antiporter [Candidatus Altiarchaeota archaeon]
MVLTNLALFVVGCLVLVKSSEALVDTLSKIAAYFRVTEFVIGFILMAFATSVPELSIGVSSALESTLERPLTSLALGNIVGANIIDLTLVIGIGAILRRDIKVETKAVRTDTIYMFLIASLPLILMMDSKITQADGIFLIFVFFIYILRLLKQRSRFREKSKMLVSRREFHKNVTIFMISIILLFLSAICVVENATELAAKLGVPNILIGLFMISLGTTLPELTFGTKAVLSEHPYMALGNVIGSIIVNSTLILGLTAIIFPIQTADFLVFLTSALFMLTVAFMFMTFIEAERHILWQEGVGLILLYVLFVIVELSIHQFETTQIGA